MYCSVCQLPIAEAVLDRACPFCSAVFSRADGARRHAKACPQRGDRDLQARKRGRKALSCDNCSRIKIHCNARIRTPCEGCVSRKVTCTFTRCCIDPAHRELAGKTTSSQADQDRDRLTLSFLLNSTDDKQDFITERAVGEEPEGDLIGPICATSSQSQSPMDYIPGYIDPMLLLPFDSGPDLLPLQLDELYNADSDNLLGSLLDPQHHEDVLVQRLDLLELEIKAYAQHSFDNATFQRLFNASNVHTFASTFCRKRHYQYPILHWPTFVLEEASLSLLLVVALTGATYSFRPGHSSEHIKAARAFYPLADAYVFGQLETCLQSSPPDIDESPHIIQLCQAALLMYGLVTLSGGDSEMKRAALTKRLPALISALRRLDLLACRHELNEDWQLFLQREQIIRLVTWTFCADCLATLSCNNPPLCSMLEMTGHLPSGTELWDAKSALEFEQLRAETLLPSYCLKDLMDVFFDKRRRSSPALENVPIFHLHVLMCAFQPLIFNLHVSLALPSQSDNLLTTLETWRNLWRKALHKIPEENRDCLGVAKYIPGIEYLSRKIIEVAVSRKADSLKYLRRIPSSGTREIHEFIKTFVAGAEDS